jgi:hypothetical protein
MKLPQSQERTIAEQWCCVLRLKASQKKFHFS